jgi:hypothetical protein
LRYLECIDAVTASDVQDPQSAGLPVHSFETLMVELATRGLVTYRLKSEELGLTFKQVPDLTPIQARAHELLGLLPVAGN